MDIDPNTLLEAFGKLGVAGVLIWWFAKRDDRNRDQAEAREIEAKKHCDAERESLVSRIQQVEDRQYKDHADIIRSAIDALRTNARAFEYWSKVETDKFPALDKKGDG